ncbi:hypothetical protein Purlil1_6645 [Purpureocillium lilacinum]|uniref:Uncharacterized protein n=1 Tax=Purpureocillium lilacinum TaxID=33203 RepID=A0ABR0BYV5_PURLI|nr:hypothetical protein Purlil1_6645 [Purpureocillium lilacinum]
MRSTLFYPFIASLLGGYAVVVASPTGGAAAEADILARAGYVVHCPAIVLNSATLRGPCYTDAYCLGAEYQSSDLLSQPASENQGKGGPLGDLTRVDGAGSCQGGPVYRVPHVAGPGVGDEERSRGGRYARIRIRSDLTREFCSFISSRNTGHADDIVQYMRASTPAAVAGVNVEDCFARFAKDQRDDASMNVLHYFVLPFGVAEDTRMMDSKASEEKVDMYHFEAGADGTSSKRRNQHIGDLICCRWSGGLLSVPGIQSRYQVSGTKARDMPRGPRREPPLLVRHKVLVPRPLPRDECPRRRPNGEADGER